MNVQRFASRVALSVRGGASQRLRRNVIEKSSAASRPSGITGNARQPPLLLVLASMVARHQGIRVRTITPHVGEILKERGEGVICAEQIHAYRSRPAGHLPVLGN